MNVYSLVGCGIAKGCQLTDKYACSFFSLRTKYKTNLKIIQEKIYKKFIKWL